MKDLRRKKAAFRFDVDDARRVLDRVDTRFPNVRKFMRFLENAYNANGYIRNPFGRKLYLSSPDKAYALLNADVQSSAADMLKVATIDVHRRLEREDVDARLIFSKHDELELDLSVLELERVRTICVEEMTKFRLRVPIDVELGATAGSWADAIGVPKTGPIPWDAILATAVQV